MTEADQPYHSQRVALVTGAGGAIGGAIARHLAAAGATVIAVDLAGSALEPLASESIHPLELDVTDEAAVDLGLQAVVDEHGGLDILVNNAGITRDSTLHKMELAAWQSVLAVNLTGPFLLTRAYARHLRERRPGWGRVVNISSISAKIGIFGQANYASSKAGLVALTKVTARELARLGVTANAIMPGFIVTPMTDAIPQEMREQRIAEIPVGRPGTTDDVAGTVDYLCSDAGAYVTGVVIEVTGGRGIE